METQTKQSNNQQHRGRKIILIILASILAVIVAMVIGLLAYAHNYYHADSSAISLVLNGDDKVSVVKLQDLCAQSSVKAPASGYVFVPTSESGQQVLALDSISADAGLIFYPGGKVEATSYAPLMRSCAERNIVCVLVEMPLNLAVLDANAADGIPELFSGIESWYIGGHSLGGAMAATYAAKHASVANGGSIDGLILLGSYSTADLTSSGLKVLTVYGTCDGVLNRGRYDECRSNLPDDAVEVVIDGGCHSYFGDYGMQDGDGQPTITRGEQQTQTADAIALLCLA